MPIATHLGTESMYNDLQQRQSAIERQYEADQLEIANDMAEVLIANGGATIHIEQFALAMHGLVHYHRDSSIAKVSSKTIANREILDEQTKPQRKAMAEYGNLTESVARVWLGGAALMANGRGPQFATVIDQLQFPLSDGFSGGLYPLRFLIEKREETEIHNPTYEGRVVLPILQIDMDKDATPSPSVIVLAETSRSPDELDLHRRWHSYGKPRQKLTGWTIGQGEVARQWVSDYRSVEESQRRLDVVATAAKKLEEYRDAFTEGDWAESYQKAFA